MYERKVLVCGSRSLVGPAVRKAVYDALTVEAVTVVIAGGAAGPDTFAADWARLHKVPLYQFFADWETYGVAAGARRNRAMVRELEPGRDLVLAFQTQGSPGTQDMIGRARFNGIEVVVKLF